LLGVEDWAEIRRLHRAEGIPIKALARRFGVSRNTVRAAVRSTEPPRYVRRAMPSAVDAVEADIRRLLGAHPRMPAKVIAERVGWERGLTVLRERVRELRPLFLPPDPAGRTSYRPGELAQWDLWFPAVDIPLGFGLTGRPPVLVGVSGYSRWMVARMIPTRQSHDLLLGHLACLVELGRVPRSGVYDNEGAIGRWRGGRPELTPAFQAFRGTLGMGVILLKPGDPEAKGLVERANGYLETSFLPGRRFASPADFNVQLSDWLVLANGRHHRSLDCRPLDRIAEDRAAMLALPPVLPDPAFRTSTRVGRDHWVRVLGSDYSVQPRVIGRRVEVRADHDEVVITCAGELVARHPRSLVRHRTVTDPAHEVSGLSLREARRELVASGTEPEVEMRDLASYDRLLGVPQ
jgi:transposase